MQGYKAATSVFSFLQSHLVCWDTQLKFNSSGSSLSNLTVVVISLTFMTFNGSIIFQQSNRYS